MCGKIGYFLNRVSFSRAADSKFAFLEAIDFGKVFLPELDADFCQFLVKVGLLVQVFRLVIHGDWRKHIGSRVHLGIKPGYFIPCVNDHSLVGIRQRLGHFVVGLRRRLAVLALHLDCQRLAHENLGNRLVLPGKELLVDFALGLARGFQLDFRAVRNDSDRVLNHAGKIAGNAALVIFRCLRWGHAHNPGHPVPFDKTGVKAKAATLEADRPQTARKQAQAVWVVVCGMVCDENKLAGRQVNGLRAIGAVLADKDRFVFRIEAEPLERTGNDIDQMPPVARKFPDKLKGGVAVKWRVQH